MLRDLEGELEVVDIDDAVWSTARDLARACRSAGVTAPATDLLVAACAARHSLGLLHHDRHFDAIARVAAGQ
jgi:predicted nucleic acid-binding protein